MTATQPPASNTEQTDTQVLQLEPQPGSACQPSDSSSFGKDRLSCSPEFVDILYSTRDDPLTENGEDEKSAFWLLPAQVSSLIRESTQALNTLLSPEKAADQRNQGMDAASLLEHFIEPHFSAFLKGEQKARMEGYEEREPSLVDSYAFEVAAINALSPLQLARPDIRARQAQLQEWDQLRKLAVFNAQAQGYTYRDGQLYTRQAEEARQALARYNTARSNLLAQSEMPVYSPDELAQLVAINKIRYLEATDCKVNCKAPMEDYLAWRKEQRSPIAYLDYNNAILDVANYGLALPEFALTNDDEAGLSSGVARFKHYLELLEQQEQLKDAMHEKQRQWSEATGQNVPLPSGLLDAERAQWDELQTDLQQLKAEAEARVAQSTPRRHLLWNPEIYSPPPAHRLVKADFPLREVSLPNAPQRAVQHLSLAQLKKMLTPRYAGSSTGKANQDHATSDFHDWLVQHGALRIDAQGDWFDHQGWFDGEAFYRYLQAQHYQVKTLEDPQQRHAWTEQLRQMLFQRNALRHLRLFDNSPAAQLVRCLAPPQSMLQHDTSLSGGLSLSGLNAEVKVDLGVNLARGEVEILNIDLPSRIEASDTFIGYRLAKEEETHQINLGRFSLHLGARAWGFAGASLMLAGSVAIGMGNAGYGANFRPGKRATRTRNTVSLEGLGRTQPVLDGNARKVQINDGAKAELNLFAGVQAGILATGALNWSPPPPTFQGALAHLPSSVSTSRQWLSVARLELDGAVALGLGIKGSVSLSLSRGRLILRMKAALIGGPGAEGSISFSVGYQAIGDLLDLVRRELHNNQQQCMEWVSDDAMALLAKLNVAGALGVDVGMLYLLDHGNDLAMGALRVADAVMSLYEAMTSGGRGGWVAYSILNYENQEQLKRWVVECIPQGLGPMLMTLTSPQTVTEAAKATAKDVMKTIGLGAASADKSENSGEQNNSSSYDPESAPLYQQQALERILGWIVESAGTDPEKIAAAQRQFDSACSRMNKFGSYDYKGQVYCDNRDRMDKFMSKISDAEDAGSLEGSKMRSNYRQHVKLLGALRDGYCTASSFSGTTYVPGGRKIYTGPGA
ncbi:hypothetical protein [Pseudomonas sp. DP-17]|uniref:hypothetical protein n=1 Tax=Pseudomonas sp. DP-17 TaxID=1580486 RepID=UPI001EFB7F39|nr:hypothetical protein [Pseudomonas sp. DP-17]MCG8906949.1 hypothetical protein [Pseudomonas sp. DP-17]